MSHRRSLLLCALGAGFAAALAAPSGLAAAGPPHAATPTAAAPVAVEPAALAQTTGTVELFPDEFDLPDGFLPEGIAIGPLLPIAYFGSRADGDLFRVNLVTGRGTVFSQGPGTSSVGLKVDLLGRLFVAGGAAGDARVVSAASGQVLASYQFASAPTFINDVVLTPTGAWFTDSQKPVLYQLPLGPHGELPTPAQVRTLPLSGEWVQTPGFNANGIVRTPDGTGLIVVQSSTGSLFRVDPATGHAVKVDLGAEALPNGDGLLLAGRTLYAVQNVRNQVAVVRLAEDAGSGAVITRVTDARFDVPTTVAAWGHRLYLPNARFTTPPTPTTTYNAVAIPTP